MHLLPLSVVARRPVASCPLCLLREHGHIPLLSHHLTQLRLSSLVFYSTQLVSTVHAHVPHWFLAHPMPCCMFTVSCCTRSVAACSTSVHKAPHRSCLSVSADSAWQRPLTRAWHPWQHTRDISQPPSFPTERRDRRTPLHHLFCKKPLVDLSVN